MAFVRSPDLHSIELLQKGQPKPPAEPWTSMPNTGHWLEVFDSTYWNQSLPFAFSMHKESWRLTWDEGFCFGCWACRYR